ncbi:MAG TPA: Gfo/Idh/MocA family oxidoreductase [Anaerolineaceae bacterium]|nr:Gfo/Idh/MocA family oxidoreductase [Anaerolineaceae bacterium]
MKLALIGIGEIAQKAYFPLLKTMEGVQIASIMSRSAASVEKAQARWQIPVGFTKLKDVIASRPDACLVLTTTTAHYEVAQELLENGLDVYLEKPATVHSWEVKALADLAAKNGRVLMVGYNRRFADFYVQARQLIKTDEILQITLEKHRPFASYTSLFSQYLDDTIHMIDLLRSFDPNPIPLQTALTMRAGQPCSAVSTLRLSSGGIATIHACLGAGAWQEKVSIHGARKSVIINAFRDLTYINEEGTRIFGPERPSSWKSELAERGFYAEVQHFMDCVRTRKTPLTDGYEAYKTQLLVEQLVQLAGEPLEHEERDRNLK